MTIVATNVRELDLNQLMLRAMQTAGIMAFEQVASGPQWDNRVKFGRDMLELILDKLQVDGLILRDIERYSLTLTSGTASYALPADTIDVLGDAMYQSAAGETEFTVSPMDRETYHAIANKTQTGTPSRYWVERLATCTVYLHQVPDTTDAVLYLQRKKMLADSSSGTATPDLERYGHDYLHYELAYRFSIGLPFEERQALRADANEAKAALLTYAKQALPTQIELVHRTGW